MFQPQASADQFYRVIILRKGDRDSQTKGSENCLSCYLPLHLNSCPTLVFIPKLIHLEHPLTLSYIHPTQNHTGPTVRDCKTITGMVKQAESCINFNLKKQVLYSFIDLLVPLKEEQYVEQIFS